MCIKVTSSAAISSSFPFLVGTNPTFDMTEASEVFIFLFSNFTIFCAFFWMTKQGANHCPLLLTERTIRMSSISWNCKRYSEWKERFFVHQTFLFSLYKVPRDVILVSKTQQYRRVQQLCWQEITTRTSLQYYVYSNEKCSEIHLHSHV